ncbi:MAG: SDR family NAD(P)-dependent oxidoreductase [Alphaproteobacteria bacterium]
MIDPGSLTVLVTGASAGIGAACARHFASAGARVIGAARRKDRLEELAAGLGAEACFHAVVMDVAERSSVDAAIAGLPPDFAEIDVLISNAGVALGRGPIQDGRIEDWERIVDTNVKGALYLVHALLPAMTRRNRGHVITVGSIGGNYPYPDSNVYGATKAFLHMLALNLRADLAGTRVRVTSIEPGLTESEFALVRAKGDAAAAAKVYRDIEALLPEDVAEAAFWAATRPAHVNINRLEIMSVAQTFGPMLRQRDLPE